MAYGPRLQGVGNRSDLQQTVEQALRSVAMATKVHAMLKGSLDALVNLSSQTARGVIVSDDEVDAMNRQAYLLIYDAIRADPDRPEPLIHLPSVSRHLERIADHATNIAEDVIYMIEGEVIRHRKEEYRPGMTKAAIRLPPGSP